MTVITSYRWLQWQNDNSHPGTVASLYNATLHSKPKCHHNWSSLYRGAGIKMLRRHPDGSLWKECHTLLTRGGRNFHHLFIWPHCNICIWITHGWRVGGGGSLLHVGEAPVSWPPRNTEAERRSGRLPPARFLQRGPDYSRRGHQKAKYRK